MTGLERLDRIISNCRETITAAESWANNRTDESPLDCESERLTLASALRCRRAILYGDIGAARREVAAMQEFIDSEG